jgi:hydrogenase maturation protease
MSHGPQYRVLVACIGNIFLGDDGFGCQVARDLAGMELPSDATVVDYGIRGLDLAYALLEPHDAVIIVDAIVRGDAPGTIYLLEPAHPSNDESPETALDPHSMDPAHLLAMARSLGTITADIFIVGCEPLDFGDELEGRMELSSVVKNSVPQGARAVCELIGHISQQQPRQAEPLHALH